MDDRTKTITQYAQDLLVEYGWSLADVDDKLAKSTRRLMADSCGRPGEYDRILRQSFCVAREAARLIAEHDAKAGKVKLAAEIRERYADFFSKTNGW